MRWGELVGLETKFVRPESIRIEWQLYELDTGELRRCPPKDDSYRDIGIPEWLRKLIIDHIARSSPQPCVCHDQMYVFRGLGPANKPPVGQGRSSWMSLGLRVYRLPLCRRCSTDLRPSQRGRGAS